MVKSSVLNECPNSILGWPISPRSQVALCFLTPTLAASILYMIHFAADLVLVVQHFRDNNPHWAGLTLTFLYLPTVVCFVFTITDPGHWPKSGGINAKVGWFILKMIQHAIFPVWAMHVHAERIFWSIEAVRTKSDADRDECLWKTIKTRPIELYFFLQAYLQAIPQMFLQLNIILHQDKLKIGDLDTVNLQLTCVMVSILKLSYTTMVYQHYESQKLLGRRYPWSRKRGLFSILEKEFPDGPDEPDNAFEDNEQLFMPGCSGENQSTGSGPYENDMSELRKTPPLIEIVSSSSLRGPDYPAPKRPDSPTSTAVVSSNDSKVFNMTNIKRQFNNTIQLTINNVLGKSIDSVDLPIRKYPKYGRQQDDFIGQVVVFTIWYCFTFSRILCLSVFGKFFFQAMLYIMLVHYVVTFIVIMAYTKTRDFKRILLYLFLAYVFIFTMLEFRIKFKHFFRMYIAYFIVIYTENFILTMIWGLKDWDSWWFRYLLWLIVGNSIMAVAFIILYIKFLKPSKETLYELGSK